MPHERSNGNGRDGGGGGDDDVDGYGAPDDPTVVIVPEEYVLGVLGRLARGMRNAAARLERFREALADPDADPALQEMILDELQEELEHNQGYTEASLHGVERLRRFVRAKRGAKP